MKRLDKYKQPRTVVGGFLGEVTGFIPAKTIDKPRNFDKKTRRKKKSKGYLKKVDYYLGAKTYGLYTGKK